MSPRCRNLLALAAGVSALAPCGCARRQSGVDPAPDRATSYAAQAELHWQKRQFREAAADYEEALRYRPNDVSTILALIQTRRDAGDESRTEELARRALAIQPDNPKALVYLGGYLARLSPRPDSRREARTLLEQAVRLAPTMPLPYVELGRLELSQGDYTLARFNLEAAWTLLFAGQRTLAQLETMGVVEQKRAETAYALAACAQAQHDNSAAARWRREFSRVDARIAQRSILESRAAADPPDVDAIVRLAAMDMETGGAAEAVGLVKRGLVAAPGDPRLLRLVDALKHTEAGPR